MYVPDYILTNDELSKMVDTNNDWIMSRVGIKERHILKGEGQGASVMGAEALKSLLAKTNTKPEEIDLVLCTTVTPDMMFPATAAIICDKVGIKNAFAFDLNSGCSGFIVGLSVASQYVETGKCKKVVVISAEKMSSITDYTDRSTCPLFGDAGTAALIEPTYEEYGVMDQIIQTDGSGAAHLHMKAGGSALPASHDTVYNREHFIYQEGQIVFKWAVTKMADVAVEIMKRNNLNPATTYLAPHQANLRIIDAVGRRMEIDPSRVMINIEKYGNTSSCTIPIVLNEWIPRLKKGDDIIIASFGTGFTWGATWLKWGM
jgi:3-oxoacyl-[acyl-carrier-protein] synthase-3